MSTRRRWIAAGCVGAGLLIAGLAAAVQVLGAGNDGAALIAIATPHMLLASLVLAAIGLVIGRSKGALVGTLVIAVGAAAVLGDEWISVPDVDDSRPITVMSWNIEFGSNAADQLPAVLLSTDADIVALQELTPDAAAAIEAHPEVVEAFPHRVLRPVSGVLGLGLLSRWPMRAGSESTDPAVLTASVTLDGQRTLQVLNAHPLPGRILTIAPMPLPIGFDGSDRDRGLRTLRRQADRLAAAGAPVVLLGDLNVAPTEPAYDELVAGWRDAHVEAGIGPGWTWRPSRIQGLKAGLLRIDYVLVTPDVQATSSRQDCTPPGDHCVVTVGLDIPSDAMSRQ